MSTLIVPMVQINLIERHPNADTLSIAKFEGLGWQSIIKTGDYKVGDWVIFVPPDAILPQWIVNDQNITYLKNKKNRVGAVKLRGTLSEGIVLPLDILNRSPFLEMGQSLDVMAGESVDSILGITKYEPDEPAYAGGPKARKDRPYNNRTFPIYTDIQHLKNFPDALGTMTKVVVLEKIHGTNFRAGWALKQKFTLKDRIAKLFGKYSPYYFTCGSRRVEMGTDRPKTTWYDRSAIKRKRFEWNLYQKWANKLRDKIPFGYIFYGEIYGDGVQDLTYGLKGETNVVIFDVYHDGHYVNYNEMLGIVPASLTTAPLMYIGDYDPEIVARLTDGLSWLASTHDTKQIREGVVVKAFTDTVDPVYGRLIFKSVSVDYLTRKGGTEFK